MRFLNSRRGLFFGLAGTSLISRARGAFAIPATSNLARVQEGYVDARKVLLWESTRKEIREALESGRLKAAILPTGSTEQHNEHLAMIQDTASAVLVAQQAALQLYPRVTVATPVAVGISPYWMERPGTLTLRPETFLAMVYDICESLRHHGIKNILIVNGHGGNDQPLKSHVPEFSQKLDVKLEACSYWDAFASGAAREEAKKYMETGLENIPGHSAEFETSFALAGFPQRVHRDGVDYEKVNLKLRDPKDAADDRRYYSESLKGRAEKGEALIRLAVDWVAARVGRMIETS
jgi:creatinine amidohydrolase/Fe(II)-dependent formamide hydrolase-like protein